MQIDTDKIAQQCIDAINEKIKNLNTLNIIVVGKSGVGNSTLINSLFIILYNNTNYIIIK